MDKDFGELIEYLDKKFGYTDTKFFALEENLKDIRSELKSMREAVQELTVSIDRLAGAISDLQTEYAAITNQVNRHEKWMHQIADKLGVKLEY